MTGQVQFDFAGQEVLITGGSNGIGLAIAKAFRDAGATVTITGTKADAGDYGHDLSGLDYRQLDMGDALAIAEIGGSGGPLDVLVNCAGAGLGPAEYQDDGWQRVIDINLNGSRRMAMAALPRLSQAKGSLVNIASMSSYAGFPTAPAYGAGKTAIVSLTKSLAMAWAEHGIRVNAIAPGWVETNMTRAIQADDARNRAILARTPMARWAAADEMAGSVLFLSSDAAQFITGAVLPVDGGYSAS